VFTNEIIARKCALFIYLFVYFSFLFSILFSQAPITALEAHSFDLPNSSPASKLEEQNGQFLRGFQSFYHFCHYFWGFQKEIEEFLLFSTFFLFCKPNHDTSLTGLRMFLDLKSRNSRI
jgi:hypothetical protein